MHFRHLTLRFLLAILGAFPVFAAACSGDGGEITPPPKYTLENLCAKLAPLACEQRKTCCLQGTGYDQTSCEATQKTECEANVADVRAGKMTFDGTNVDACLAAIKPYADKCTLTIPDTYALLEDTLVCNDVFLGQLAEGQVCERSAQCKPSTAEKEYVGCDPTTKKCVVTRLLPDGAACSLGAGVKEYCEQGLYCDATMAGSCKPATPAGDACDAMPALSLECGLGYYCNKTSGNCEVTQGDGAACNNGAQCQSFTCDMTTMKCTAPDLLFDEADCKGITAP